MADVKKWSVTYTKHVKQKRKVYQDGFLEFHKTTNKLFLYDDGEKLLECRILKKDEAVSCGETLTFNAFLVDVNGAEGDHEEPPHSSNLLRRENQTAEKSKSQRLTLSPSQKIIKDFKKRELLKYEAIQSKSLDTMKTSVTEWEVLYTTQLTQKAKKYHDGFVQLSIRGSIGRQLMLLDASRTSLDSRVLRKGEKIESGATITFDGHLVEIGEPRGDHKSFEKNYADVKGEKGVVHGQRSCGYRKNSIKNEVQNAGVSHGSQDSAEPSATEWQVLYTTQLTQKSKKYHDGFLKLAICGSLGRQAMLYDENRKLLNTRLLKREEVLRTGVSVVLDAYLIDIGEPEVKNETSAEFIVQRNNCNVLKRIGTMHRQQNSLTSNNYALKGKTHTNNCLKKDVESKFNISNMSTKEASREDPSNKGFRDVHQILSILQKPRTENSTAAGYSDDNVTSAKGPSVSNAADLDLPEDDQPPKSSEPHDQSSENVDARESRECMDLDRPSDIMFSKDISSGSVNQLDKVIDNGNSHQLYSENTGVGVWCDGAYASNMPSSTISCGPLADKGNCSPELTCATEMERYPSFDLGF